MKAQRQKGIAGFFGGKDIESTKKSAAIREQTKTSVDAFHKIISGIKLPSENQEMKIPKEVQKIITWKPGDDIPFSLIAKNLDEIEKLSGKIEIEQAATKYFLSILTTTPQDIIPYAFMLFCIVRPEHEGVKLNVGEESIKNAIKDSVGVSKAKIESLYKEEGDLALVAQKLSLKQKSLDSMFGKSKKEYTIKSVYEKFIEISSYEGNKTTQKKQGVIQSLISDAKGQNVKYIIRLLQCKLRVGAGKESFLKALGVAFKKMEYITGKIPLSPCDDDLDKASKKFRKIFNRHPLIDDILIHCIQGGLEEADKECQIIPGIPLMPMLAKPAKKLDEIKRRLGDGEITGEYKYDGERAMIHKTKNGKIRIFSRSAEDSTEKFGDVADIVKANVKGSTFILDSEIVAYDTEKKKILPFQDLIHRKKKGGEEPPTIQVCIFTFDLIYLDGEPLTSLPFRERREKLHSVVTPVEGKLLFATYKNAKSINELGEFFTEAKNNNTEGLMVKTLDGEYQPNKRSQMWGKLKKDYISADVFEKGDAEDAAPPDTIDAVVIGATYGTGKRTGCYGAFLLGVYNNDTNKFESLAFVGTGFSEEKLDEFYKALKPTETTKCPPNVECKPLDKNPVFFEPKMVWEIAVADLQTTPKYSACWGDMGDCGITIRFGRYQRTRTDKSAEQCTSTEQILELYHAQFDKK